MKKIAYIVPYFGNLPDDFELWLLSCKYNPSVNWIMFIDDKRNFNYPPNVKVYYITFKKLKNRIQALFDFPISLDTPYRLCDFKVAYGEIFQEELTEYDYWGYCDIDLIFGDIRGFITEDILNTYEKIGFQGHSTIYLNTSHVNKRYRYCLNGKSLYKEYFTMKGEGNNYFDEDAINKIYEKLKIPYFSEITFANINPMYWNFQLTHQDSEGIIKNKNRIFTWDRGKLYSLSVVNGYQIKDEYMYVHFLRRPMACEVNFTDEVDKLLIIPNKILPCKDVNITSEEIRKYSRNKQIKYWIYLVWRKRKKMTVKNIYNFLKFRFIVHINEKLKD